MPRRRKGAKFEQISEFERDRIVGLHEAGMSYHAVAARVQRNSSTIMRVSKQWTDEGRTAWKSGSGPRNVTSARDDRRLVRMAQTDRIASSRQLAAQWSTATGVLLCASSIRKRLLQRGLRARIPLYRIPLTQNHRSLRLQWANVHRSWRADWQHVVFSDESRFNLWHHDGRIRVRRYAGERHIPECIIERYSGRTPGVMVWGAIAYHGRSQLLRIVGNLNSTRSINEALQPQAIPSCKDCQELYSSRIMPVHMSRRLPNPILIRSRYSLFIGLRIPWICHRLNMCGISLGGVSLVIFVLLLRQTNFGCAYKQYGILFCKQIFKICLTPCRVV
ncbi:transposable element Tc1 transposase [Trichonephila clavipes]|uniref:Transposable element Tc1 transposase n=1 Tax=Trichonephila clavipes TaxID=2585209 RepID=A0A8X7B8Z2_TRICX|nr:transposable element Tc1 transposase [Trichonephila clavipes]